MADFVKWLADWRAAEVVQAFILLGGLIYAGISVASARKTARQNAFLAFVRNYNSDSRIDDAIAILRAGYRDNLSKEEMSRLKYFLNEFEILAIGLKAGIYDCKMVTNSFGLELVTYHDQAALFIRDIRKESGGKRAYSEFEILAHRIHRTLK